MKDFSIVIPVYHGEKVLEKLTETIVNDCKQYNYEIIFVYDCGPDRSWDVICKMKERYGDLIQAIHLSRNFGQHNAILCGITISKGNFIVTMDEDLQHLPADIPLLLEEQKRGDFDLVYGKYRLKEHSFFRNFTSNLLKKLIAIGIPDLYNEYSAFRVIKKTVALEIVQMNNSYTFLDGYLNWVTSSASHVFVQHQQRQGGTSSYTLKKLINHSINIFVTFSNLPIRLLSYSSILIFFLTTLYSIYITCRKLIFNDLAVGYPSLIITIGFGISIVLLGLGIIGEYLHRINLKTTKKPIFSIRKKI